MSSSKDISSCTFVMRPQEIVDNGDDIDIILTYLTPSHTHGILESEEETDECCAKKAQLPSGVMKYYVKTSSKGFLMDPWGQMSESKNAAYAKHAGKPLFVWKEVTQTPFEYYGRYLATRNSAELFNAQRMIISGE